MSNKTLIKMLKSERSPLKYNFYAQFFSPITRKIFVHTFNKFSSFTNTNIRCVNLEYKTPGNHYITLFKVLGWCYSYLWCNLHTRFIPILPEKHDHI